MRLLSTFTFAAATMLASAQQISNGNFESWHFDPVYEDIDDWTSDNPQFVDNPPVTKVADAGFGNAAHLESRIIGTDSIFGLLLAGKFVGDVPTEGVLFGTAIDAVKLDYRGEWLSNDSGLVFIGIWSGGVMAAVSAITVGGSVPSWSQLTFSVNGAVEIIPDSLVFAIASSNPLAPDNLRDGSWMEVDNVNLVAASVGTPDHLANSEMDNWHDLITWECTDWSSLNRYLIGYGDTVVTPDPLAYDGAYAARIETLELGGDTLPGLFTTGTIDTQGIRGGTPYTGSAASLDGWYRYDPIGSDTAHITAYWYDHGNVIGLAEQVIVGGASGWIPFTAPAFIPGAPDTLLVVITSGKNPGTVLYVDSLHLVGITTVIQEATASAWSIDPDPATDLITLHTTNAIAPGTTYRVFDSMGRTVIGAQWINRADQGIDVEQLAPGRYWIEVKAGAERHPLGFVKR